MHSNTQGPSSALTRVTLTSVTEPEPNNGNLFFKPRFKRGPFGKPATRTFWGRPDDAGNVVWERASPEELVAIVGQDLTGTVEVVPVDHEPKTFTVESTGEIREYSTTAVVVFSDESLEQVCRRYGITPRAATPATAATPPPAPAGFVMVPTNGHKAEPA